MTSSSFITGSTTPPQGLTTASPAPGSAGGVYAVAGFLFQMLGSAAFAVKVFGRKPMTGAADTEMLFSLEPYDQDAGQYSIDAKGLRRMKLVQFKYSGNPDKYGIATAELLEIAEAFRRSDTRIKEGDKNCITDHELWTNRSLTDDGVEALNDAKTATTNAKLDATDKKAGRTKSRNADYRDILKQLQVETINEREIRDRIQEHTRALGITDAEFAGALNNVVAHFFALAASGASTIVTEQFFNKLLTGFSDPNQLSLSALTPRMREEIVTFKKSARLPKNILPRSVLVSIENALEEHALVIIHGDGGCGKSAAIHSALSYALGESSESARCYAAAEFAREFPEHWFCRLVARWRNAPPAYYYTDPPELALERLEIAARTAPRPLTILALDGWDELDGSSRIGDLVSLLRFVGEQWKPSIGEAPRIVLLVTCREADDVFRVWPHYTGYLTDGSGIKRIPVGDFDSDELTELARTYLSPAIALRLAEESRPGIEGQSAGIIGGRALQTRPVDPEIRRAIQHPLFWRFFSEKDEALQQRILDRETAALWCICSDYINWFIEKTRHKTVGADLEALKAMLRRIVEQPTPAGGQLLQEEHWTKPACGLGLFRAITADNLFHEARTFGLITVDAPVQSMKIWRWRHPFMAEFIRTQVF